MAQLVRAHSLKSARNVLSALYVNWSLKATKKGCFLNTVSPFIYKNASKNNVLYNCNFENVCFVQDN